MTKEELLRLSAPPGGLSLKQWLQVLGWAATLFFGTTGFVWGAAVTFADLQDEAEVKEVMAPIAAAASANATEIVGFKVKVGRLDERVQAMAKSQDRLEGKLDAVLEVSIEALEHQRDRASPQARPRARRRAAATSARVRKAAADDADPLGAL